MTNLEGATARRCQGCGSAAVKCGLDLGMQPTTNRFLRSADAAEALHKLRFGYCSACGLAQLTVPWTAAQLQPQVDWVVYREPEAHLPHLIAALAALPGLTPAASIWGVTAKDTSALDQFRSLGFRDTWRPDPAADLKIEDRRANVETLQERLTPALAETIAARRGQADLVIIRHVLEHAFDLPGFIAALRTFVKPSGYLVVEVPDCSRALEALDYSTIWEEHSAYFTPTTLASTMRSAGLEEVRSFSYPYPVENALALVLRSVEADGQTIPAPIDAASEIDRARRFCHAFGDAARALRQALARLLPDGRKAVLFGAGHLACAFLNYHDLADFFAFVVDDNINKQGLFMPGSHLPIRPSSALAESGIDLALTCFAPENEDAVIARNAAFTERGGRFLSIFPSSGRAIHRLF
jgi:hypothetical protein